MKFPCFFYDPAHVGNLISGSSPFSKSTLYIWKFLVHILLKPNLKDFKHNLASMWNECNYTIVWTFSGISLLWDWNENGPFPILWPLLSFPNFLAFECSTLAAASFRILNRSAGIPSSPIALFIVMFVRPTSHSSMSGCGYSDQEEFSFCVCRSSVYTCNLF